MSRLSLAILSWTECLKGVSADSTTGIDTSMDTDPASSQPQHNLGGTPELGVSLYSLPFVFVPHLGHANWAGMWLFKWYRAESNALAYGC